MFNLLHEHIYIVFSPLILQTWDKHTESMMTFILTGPSGSVDFSLSCFLSAAAALLAVVSEVLSDESAVLLSAAADVEEEEESLLPSLLVFLSPSLLPV